MQAEGRGGQSATGAERRGHMKPLNILYVVPYAPTLIRVRPYNLIRFLQRAGHRVTLATLVEAEAERESLAALAGEGVRLMAEPISRQRKLANALRAAPTRTPLQAVYSWQPRLAGAIRTALGEQATAGAGFDVVHVEHLRGARYALDVAEWSAANGRRPPVVWDSVDCISHLFEQAARSSRSLFGRLMTRLELGRTRRYEGWLVGRFDRVLVTSTVDRQALTDLAAALDGEDYSERVMVLSNGVDLDYFTPVAAGCEPATIVFTGKMSYHANLTAALYLIEQVMPLVWQRRPDAKLVIAGSSPPDRLRRLAAERAGHVEVTGRVSDLRPYLTRACVAVAPLLYGAGVQNKVLEAMACATPVVTTTRAVMGLRPEGLRHCAIADTPQTFAEAIVALMSDADQRRRAGEGGRRYVETYHNWLVIARDLAAVYHRLKQN